MGRFTLAGKRHAFPLGLNAAPVTVRGRTVAIGNAAQTLHPVAGQGLSLGLRDAFVLADALRTGCTPRSLQDFAARHRLDRAVTIGVTDFLPRVFALPSPLAAHARGASLTALACLPPLKHALAPDDVRHAALRPGLGQRLAGPGGAPAPGLAIICSNLGHPSRWR